MMRLGKLDNDELERLVLSKYIHTREESLCAPEVGQDCATLDLHNDLTVLSCDPITSAGISQLGSLTVHVCCNDAAAAGAEPVGLLVALLVPPTLTKDDIARVADDLSAAAKEAHVDVIGGHTEVTDAVTRAVTIATVVARMPRSRTLCGMQAGDDIVLTKWAGLEGTTILATDCADRLSALAQSELDEAKALVRYLSVVDDSRIAVSNGATQMHDVTEGGVLGAAWEMAYTSHAGIRLDPSAVPVLPVTRRICDALSIDPLRLISSGSLLISCRDGERLVAALKAGGVPAAVIGKAEGNGLTAVDGGTIAPPGADEIYSLFHC